MHATIIVNNKHNKLTLLVRTYVLFLHWLAGSVLLSPSDPDLAPIFCLALAPTYKSRKSQLNLTVEHSWEPLLRSLNLGTLALCQVLWIFLAVCTAKRKKIGIYHPIYGLVAVNVVCEDLNLLEIGLIVTGTIN